ncbi:hypothetical protein TUM4438_37100 [Shewanella sairae]|uniref:LRAT domain-containing protein n=1 Tax=Shewanella sairae TaxID=190310 RepID=A0ABQ4PPN5_9GAMM|nr:hypothetical protein [Shewanella sairae]MCL1132045.1 hypothetical protein [Shewanella sairae]GIU50578.1 hypothetical protein TUM4438_37100 [Shewanella sairae]
MALPLIWLGAAAIGAAIVIEEKEKQKEVALKRQLGKATKKHVDGQSAELAPSLWQTGDRRVKPEAGGIVCCFVFGVIEHTGIWIGDNTLVELHGSGLVRAVSAERFLAGRSGSRIYQACNHNHQPLIAAKAFYQAQQAIFSYRDYDLFDNNCHRFVWRCISGEDCTVQSFGQLNNKIGSYFGEAVYWDELC